MFVCDSQHDASCGDFCISRPPSPASFPSVVCVPPLLPAHRWAHNAASLKRRARKVPGSPLWKRCLLFLSTHRLLDPYICLSLLLLPRVTQDEQRFIISLQDILSAGCFCRIEPFDPSLKERRVEPSCSDSPTSHIAVNSFTLRITMQEASGAAYN